MRDGQACDRGPGGCRQRCRRAIAGRRAGGRAAQPSWRCRRGGPGVELRCNGPGGPRRRRPFGSGRGLQLRQPAIRQVGAELANLGRLAAANRRAKWRRPGRGRPDSGDRSPRVGFLRPRRRRHRPAGLPAVPGLLQGKTVRVLGDPDMPLTFTHIPDLACILAVFGTDGRSWGRPWHVPSAEPTTQREALSQMALLAGAPAAKVGRIPDVALRAIWLVSPLIRELGETAPQRTCPDVLHSSAATEVFGLRPTPLHGGLAATVRWWQGRVAA